MSNPFDDLTEQELEEMVEFCQKYFFPCNNCGDTHGEDWKWKKGDWRAVMMKGKMLYIELVGESGGWSGEAADMVPLPLAHQWIDLFLKMDHSDRVMIDHHGVTFFTRTDRHNGLGSGLDYACHLAFKTVIENDD